MNIPDSLNFTNEDVEMVHDVQMIEIPDSLNFANENVCTEEWYFNNFPGFPKHYYKIFKEVNEEKLNLNSVIEKLLKDLTLD